MVSLTPLFIYCYLPANVSSKLLDLREEFGLHRVVTLLPLRPLMAESQPGLNQVSSTLSLRDGSMEIFSDTLLAANLWDDLKIREQSEDHSDSHPPVSLLMLVTWFKNKNKKKAVLDFFQFCNMS